MVHAAVLDPDPTCMVLQLCHSAVSVQAGHSEEFHRVDRDDTGPVSDGPAVEQHSDEGIFQG